MYIEAKACWLNQLVNALEKYNNCEHTTTRMTPFEASNNKLLPSNNNRTAKLAPHNNNKLLKFQVGDFVRDPDKRNFYSNGYTTNRNRALFKRHKVNPTNQVTYALEDENGEINQIKL